MKLSELQIGDKAIIRIVLSEGPMKRRFMDMGVLKNVEVVLEKRAPMGDPLELILKGYRLSLRKSEAEHIIVEKI